MLGNAQSPDESARALSNFAAKAIAAGLDLAAVGANKNVRPYLRGGSSALPSHVAALLPLALGTDPGEGREAFRCRTGRDVLT
jgi:hypothetical protein